MSIEPALITGGSHSDKRGVISFVNSFAMDKVKRFYQIEHRDVNIVRAWQAHKIEHKWFYITEGSFVIIVVQPDSWVGSPNSIILKQFILSTEKPQILYVPGGYATGFKAIKPNSKLIVFSDFTVEQSTQDDYRFDQNLWFDWEIFNNLT